MLYVARRCADDGTELLGVFDSITGHYQSFRTFNQYKLSHYAVIGATYNVYTVESGRWTLDRIVTVRR